VGTAPDLKPWLLLPAGEGRSEPSSAMYRRVLDKYKVQFKTTSEDLVFISKILKIMAILIYYKGNI